MAGERRRGHHTRPCPVTRAAACGAPRAAWRSRCNKRGCSKVRGGRGRHAVRRGARRGARVVACSTLRARPKQIKAAVHTPAACAWCFLMRAREMVGDRRVTTRTRVLRVKVSEKTYFSTKNNTTHTHKVRAWQRFYCITIRATNDQLNLDVAARVRGSPPPQYPGSDNLRLAPTRDDLLTTRTTCGARGGRPAPSRSGTRPRRRSSARVAAAPARRRGGPRARGHGPRKQARGLLSSLRKGSPPCETVDLAACLSTRRPT